MFYVGQGPDLPSSEPRPSGAVGYNLIEHVIAELAVENYAVIERVRVRFHRG